MTLLFNLFSAIVSVSWITISLSLIAGWFRLPLSTNTLLSRPLSVSILIAARNEEETIGNCLRDIMEQDYPSSLIEVIVVDDHSTDQTSQRVLAFKNKNIKLIQLNENKALNSYKKRAITEAIAHSRGELIVTTDADCRAGPGWIRAISAAYLEGNSRLISSPVVYFEEATPFQKIQSLEFMYLIGSGAACIANKVPFTCNGANLAYEKATFEAVGGFAGIDHLASGDDELLLHKIAKAYPGEVRFLKSHEAVVFTRPKETFEAFYQQRKRWASKSLIYRTKLPVVFAFFLGAYYVDMAANLVIGLWAPAPFYLEIFVLQFAVKFTLEAIFLFRITRFFRRRELLAYLLPLDLLHGFYWLLMGIAGNSGKYTWKDRKVN